MVSYVSTPTSPRHVSFMPIPVYSRQCHDDELYVLKTFEKHASHCPYCVDPLNSFLSGSTLCAKGHARGIDVAQYVYSKKGLAYSLVDRKDHQRVRLEIPANLGSIKSLLLAWEQGMTLYQTTKRVEQHKTSAPKSQRTERVRPARITTDMRQSTSHQRSGSNSSSDYERGYAYTGTYTTSPTSYYYSETSPSSPRGGSTIYRVAPGSPAAQHMGYYPR